MRQWYDFSVCANRLIKELSAIHARNKGNLWETVRAYNGSGQAARTYRDNVKEFIVETQAEINSMDTVRPLGTMSASPLSLKSREHSPGDYFTWR